MPRSPDATPDAEAMQFEIYRKMGSARRTRLALKLYDFAGISWAREDALDLPYIERW